MKWSGMFTAFVLLKNWKNSCQIKVPMEHLHHLVESMPQKIQAALRVKEGPAQYYQGVPNKIVNECIYNTGKGLHLSQRPPAEIFLPFLGFLA